ncbi:protein kinase-like domain-containing protein [Artemisia annua]|uniref:Protein kinase-like domain-containing protein n=1 Tax=Artemisia annua TaxID=35608 RepID=A0A2U1PJ48_ARTAN|nr:protein kinase-like domain-containing protein [Artemisia annua]
MQNILRMKKYNVPCPCMLMLIILARLTTSNAVESDISCLRSIKEHLEDPLQTLSTWKFDNISEGFVCGFTGVRCWNDQENRVLAIQLANMRLRGPFPMGISNCTSMQVLNLSGNYLSGSIPSNLANNLPYIVSLDLSNNNLSGSIPSRIANWSFMSVLMLDKNHLTGQIPQELSKLTRLWKFSVANNRLSGPLPILSDATFPAESYANNLELCGDPLDACIDEDLVGLFLSGFEVGCSLFTILTMFFMLFFSPRLIIRNMVSYFKPMKKIKRKKHCLIPRIPQILVVDVAGIKKKKVNSPIPLSITCNDMFNTKLTSMEKFIRRLSLAELKMATNNFDNKNAIGYGNMGIMYKAMFPNSLLLAIKRLHRFDGFVKDFLLEIEILGRLRHTNLVPLLGFCHERKKSFLVYKYMCNGTLHQWLHCRPQVEAKKMDWVLRYKIAVGIARGLSWLHNNNVLRVAHLKITSKCILLDDKFEPKISNFGNSIILMNTSGIPSSDCNFLVPNANPSPYKEDVYSFGMLLLELITGMRNNPLTAYRCGLDVCVIDEYLVGQGFDEEIYKTHKIAESCIRDEATTMLQVYQAMQAIEISRNEITVDVEDNEGDF